MGCIEQKPADVSEIKLRLFGDILARWPHMTNWQIPEVIPSAWKNSSLQLELALLSPVPSAPDTFASAPKYLSIGPRRHVYILWPGLINSASQCAELTLCFRTDSCLSRESAIWVEAFSQRNSTVRRFSRGRRFVASKRDLFY